MKVVVLGDTHFRPKDFELREKLYNQIIEDNQDCGYVIHTGDLFDTVRVGNNDLRTEDMVSRIAAIHNRHLMPLIVIKGNHDEGYKGSALDFFSSHPLIKVVNHTKVISLQGKTCLFIPWAGSKKSSVKQLLDLHHNKIDYIFGHMDMVGANNNQFITEDEDKSLWCFSPKDFHDIKTYLGHIHTPQVIDKTIRYIGTIEQLSFLEEGNKNGYLILNIETGEESETLTRGGQKYHTSREFSDLPQREKAQYHIRIRGENYSISKEEKEQYLSFRAAVKVKETSKRKDVIEINNKEDYTAEGLFKDYIQLSGKHELNSDEFTNELAEINQILLNRANTRVKGIKKFNSISTTSIGKLKDKAYHFSDGINLIYGKVGSGKTTIVESLFACLYGFYPQQERKNMSLLLRGEKGEISLSLSDTENNEYLVRRKLKSEGGSKGSLTLLGNDEVLENKTVIDAQAEVIFGNRDFMSKTCFIDQNHVFDILDRAESDRMNGLRDILGLDFFYEIEEYISNRQKEIGSKKTTENNILLAENSLSACEAELILAKEQSEELMRKKKLLEEKLAAAESKVVKQFSPTNVQKIKTVYDKVGEIKSFNDFIIPRFDLDYAEEIRKQILLTDGELRELKKQATYSCESCGFIKDLSKEIRDKEIDLTDKRSDIKEIERYYSPIKVSDLDFIEENLTISEYNNWETTYPLVLKEIQELKYQIQETQFKLGRFSADIETHPRRINQYKDQIQRQKEKLLLIDKWSILQTAFGRKGISNYILSSAVNEIQEIINDLLLDVNIDFGIVLNTQVEKKTAFVETLQVLMNSEGFDPYDCRSASSGEKNFIRILWKVAISVYLHSRNPSYRILIMDEPTANSDSSMNASLQQLILSMKHYFQQIIVVTHNEFLSSSADSVIKL